MTPLNLFFTIVPFFLTAHAGLVSLYVQFRLLQARVKTLEEGAGQVTTLTKEFADFRVIFGERFSRLEALLETALNHEKG